MQFTFTNDLPLSRTDEVVEHLLKPRLWIPHENYPDYSTWIERVHAQLRAQEKRVMVALERGRVIATVIYQQHKTRADTLEIKNVAVQPEWRGRYIASLLLRNAEIEGTREFHVRTVMLDAKTNNTELRLFLLGHRYTLAGEHDLYQLGGGPDSVFTKVVAPRPYELPLLG